MVRRSAASLALSLVVASVQAEIGAFLAQPDIHGDQVVFTREGDLWLASIASGKATRLTRHDGVESRARFAPDGRTLAFTAQYEGVNQVYTMPVAGGAPVRLTTHLSTALVQAWKPDGSGILYTSFDAFGDYRGYEVDAKGGVPVELPLQALGQGGFGASATRLVFTRFPAVSGGAWFRYQGGAKNDLWVGDLAAKSFRKVYEAKSQSQYPQWVGDRIYFVKEDNATFSVCSVTPDGRDLKRHAGPYDVEVMDLETDGQKLIYVKGNGLETFDIKTGKVQELALDLVSDRLHARPTKVNAAAFTGSASMTPTGKRLLLEARGQIVSVPAKEGETRVVLAKPGVRYRLPVVSPDGAKLAYISDETRENQVYVCETDGSKPVPITKDGGRQIDSIKWSPDGKWLAIGDSELRLRLIRSDGTDERLVTTARREITALPHSFSPDSKWLVFQDQKPWSQQYLNRINLYDIEGGKSHVVSDGMYADSVPAFSRDGKWLVFVSWRTFSPQYDEIYSQLSSGRQPEVYLLALRKDTPSPFLPENDEEPKKEEPKKAEGEAKPAETKPADTKPADEKKPEDKKGPDLDGLYRRIVKVPLPPGQYSQVDMVGSRVLAAGDGSISFYDLTAKRAGKVIAGSSFDVSADGKKLLVTGGGGFRIVDVSGTDLPPTTPTVNYASLKLDVDPAKEWEQMYWDAWRLCRDYFYVRNMHGADWNAIGEKYAKYLPQVRSRSELTELIRWLQAELSIGHSFRAQPPNPPTMGATVPAFLGVETKPEGGYHRITRIYDGDGLIEGPLAALGLNVSEGAYLLEIAGRKLSGSGDPNALLLDKAGQTISIKVNDKASEEGARTIYVKPVSAAAHRALWQRDEVRRNREYVAQKSGGKVGYVFLAAMGDPDYADFTRQYFAQIDKEAIVVDIRGNSGGYIGGVLAKLLAKKPTLRRSQRNSLEASTRYHDAFEGHLCLIIDEKAYSDGEGFPTRFRYQKLGPLIGKRTYGALVGSAPMWPLVDGGGIQVPRYGNWRDGEGWQVEGTGVVPDIEVENDPNNWARGKDDQLDRAVDEMLKRIREKPIQRPVQPADPVTAKTRGGG